MKAAKDNDVKFVIKVMGNSKKYFFASILTMFISVCLTYIAPTIVGVIVDSVFGSAPFALPDFMVKYINSIGGREYLLTHLYLCALAYLVFIALASVCNYARMMFNGKLSEGLAIELRKRMHTHILHLPYSWHMNTQTGDTMQRCSSDIDTVRNFIAGQMTDLFRVMAMILVAFTLMFMLNFELAFIAFLTVPVIFISSLLFFKHIRRQFTLTDEAEGALSSFTQEALTGVRVVKAFGKERHTRDSFTHLNKLYSDLWIRLGKLFALHWATGDVMKLLQIAIVVIFGTLFVVNGKMSSGTFVSFLMYIRAVTWPTRALARIIGDMGKAGVSITRIREILDTPCECVLPNESTPAVRGDIVFDHVSFRYNDELVLDDLSFTIKEGETFAILGGTGSGKSTITYLLNRLYDLPENSGTISIGGIDIKNIQKDYLRKNIGLVLQEPFLFSKTILENLRLVDGTLPDSELFAAAETAAVHNSVLNFSKGYDTILGERGVTLSGGQKQRVAIARTLATNPPVLVFDDSLSAVDTETDSHIRTALKRRAHRATSIIISHRATTLMEADKIMVLAQGKAVQLGTHNELLSKDGIYGRIWNIQNELENELLIS